MIADGKDEKLLDVISSHVLDKGFNVKLRELRAEFFSKQDFRIQTDKFTKPEAVEKIKKELESKI